MQWDVVLTVSRPTGVPFHHRLSSPWIENTGQLKTFLGNVVQSELLALLEADYEFPTLQAVLKIKALPSPR